MEEPLESKEKVFPLTCIVLVAREDSDGTSKDGDDVTEDGKLSRVAVLKVGVDLGDPGEHDGHKACRAQGLHDLVAQLT